MRFYFPVLVVLMYVICIEAKKSGGAQAKKSGGALKPSIEVKKAGGAQKPPPVRKTAAPRKSTTTRSTVEDTTTTTETTIQTTTILIPTPEEDLYVQHFGDGTNHTAWKFMMDWFYEPEEPTAKEYCAKAHQLAGLGDDVEVHNVKLTLNTLLFTNPNYRVKRIDVLSYRLKCPKEKNVKRPIFQFTQGIRQDCVFYLDFVGEPGFIEYKIRKHVCGITI